MVFSSLLVETEEQKIRKKGEQKNKTFYLTELEFRKSTLQGVLKRQFYHPCIPLQHNNDEEDACTYYREKPAWIPAWT